MPVDTRKDTIELDELLEKAREFAALDLLLRGFDFNRQIVCGFLKKELRHLPFVFDVLLVLAPLEPEQWRLGDVDVAALDQVAHLAIKESEKECSDMRTVDVGVGHDNDF